MNKLYSPKQIFVGSFIGGPLVAAYMFAENFKVLQQSEKVKHCWIIASLFLIFLVVVSLSIPEDVQFPSFIIPLLYSFVARYLAESLQFKKLQNIDNDSIYGWKCIVGVSLLGLVITVLIMVILVLLIM